MTAQQRGKGLKMKAKQTGREFGTHRHSAVAAMQVRLEVEDTIVDEEGSTAA